MSDSLANPVTLEWPAEPRFRSVGRLVLGGVAARVDMPVDRIDELGLALDSLTQVPVEGDRLELEVDVASDGLRVTVGRFAADPLADAAIRRVVGRLVDEAVSTAAPDGHRVILSAAHDRAIG